MNKIIIWDDVWDIHGGVILGLKHLVQLMKKIITIRQEPYDVIIHPVAQGAWLMLALLLRSNKTVAIIDRSLFLPKLLTPFVTTPCYLDKHKMLHYYQHSIMCVSTLGVEVVENDVLTVGQGNISNFTVELDLLNTIIINLSAGDQVRQLPFETTLLLINKILSRDEKCEILLVGTKSDNNFAECLCRSIPTNILNFVGKTSIDDLICIFKKAPVLVTSDTGTMHLAAMTDIHVVAYFTAGSLRHFAPVTDNCTIIQHEIGCSGCGDMCFTEEMPKPCMAAITADELFDAVSAVLESKKVAAQ